MNATTLLPLASLPLANVREGGQWPWHVKGNMLRSVSPHDSVMWDQASGRMHVVASAKTLNRLSFQKGINDPEAIADKVYTATRPMRRMCARLGCAQDGGQKRRSALLRNIGSSNNSRDALNDRGIADYSSHTKSKGFHSTCAWNSRSVLGSAVLGHGARALTTGLLGAKWLEPKWLQPKWLQNIH